ncbi:MAG TPA: hypothetical protein VGE07_15685 [Herpetosiphonaceae bacterium]
MMDEGSHAMGFTAFYWELADLPDPALRAAALDLAAWREPARRDAAFHRLLRSDSSPAQGIAMDAYARAEMDERWGLANPFAASQEAVRQRARAQLAGPPVAVQRATGVIAANYASALGALLNLAEPDDAPLIARVLASSPDPAVLDTGLRAAACALAAGDGADQPALIAALAAMAATPDLDARERAAALRALAAGGTPACAAALLAALDDPDGHVQATAAWMLADDLDRHGPRLRSLVAGWPPDAPYPASEVRLALDDAADDGG